MVLRRGREERTTARPPFAARPEPRQPARVSFSAASRHDSSWQPPPEHCTEEYVLRSVCDDDVSRAPSRSARLPACNGSETRMFFCSLGIGPRMPHVYISINRWSGHPVVSQASASDGVAYGLQELMMSRSHTHMRMRTERAQRIQFAASPAPRIQRQPYYPDSGENYRGWRNVKSKRSFPPRWRAFSLASLRHLNPCIQDEEMRTSMWTRRPRATRDEERTWHR